MFLEKLPMVGTDGRHTRDSLSDVFSYTNVRGVHTVGKTILRLRFTDTGNADNIRLSEKAD